jgi:hypothetical protein
MWQRNITWASFLVRVQKVSQASEVWVLKSQIHDKTPAVSLDSKPTNTISMKVMGNLNTALDI